jgi:GAF domain-containing protein
MEDAKVEVEEKSRQLESFNTIGRAVLGAKGLDTIIDTLMMQVGETGLFRSLAFSSVDASLRKFELKRTMKREPGGAYRMADAPRGTLEVPTTGTDIIAVVAREGRRTIIQGWDNRFQIGEAGSPLLDPATYVDKVTYFVPLVSDDQTIAILATASTIGERPEIERRLDAMAPLLDQVAVAIGHAQMVAMLSHEPERLDDQVTAHAA